jgi:hypothetical protein
MIYKRDIEKRIQEKVEVVISRFGQLLYLLTVDGRSIHIAYNVAMLCWCVFSLVSNAITRL